MNRFVVLRQINKVRWLVLSCVFAMLILLPYIHLYQTYLAAHAYDLLAPDEKRIYDAIEWLTSAFVSDPVTDLNMLKGTTWSGNLFGLHLSDPLAWLGQFGASLAFYWPFFLTIIIPLVLTLFFGRFFCGWLCPATLIYELNDNLTNWLQRAGFSMANHKFDLRLKYLVLALGFIACSTTGVIVFAAIYPPAIIGREIYYAIAQNGFGVGMVFFLITLLFDLLVARRGFCRYLCPGGALYSLFGRYRWLRIRRSVKDCNDCTKCNTVCQFGLDPLHDDFGQECNNCTACIAICPTDALDFTLKIRDVSFQGPGHLGKPYKQQQEE